MVVWLVLALIYYIYVNITLYRTIQGIPEILVEPESR